MSWTVRSSARAICMASKVEGVYTWFSMVLIVLRDTPTASAREAWVNPLSLRRVLRVFRSCGMFYPLKVMMQKDSNGAAPVAVPIAANAVEPDTQPSAKNAPKIG